VDRRGEPLLASSLDALDAITQSQINHANSPCRWAPPAVANANSATSPADYLKFSAPFDKRILEAANAKLNLHLHIEPPYLGPSAIFQPPSLTTRDSASIAEVKQHCGHRGGIDEVDYKRLIRPR
jgi:hypothetical protein